MAEIILKEHESPVKGNPLEIDIEIGGITITMRVRCPGCASKGWWVSEDRTKLYCDNCGVVIGESINDMADLKNVGWNIP